MSYFTRNQFKFHNRKPVQKRSLTERLSNVVADMMDDNSTVIHDTPTYLDDDIVMDGLGTASRKSAAEKEADFAFADQRLRGVL